MPDKSDAIEESLARVREAAEYLAATEAALAEAIAKARRGGAPEDVIARAASGEGHQFVDLTDTV